MLLTLHIMYGNACIYCVIKQGKVSLNVQSTLYGSISGSHVRYRIIPTDTLVTHSLPHVHSIVVVMECGMCCPGDRHPTPKTPTEALIATLFTQESLRTSYLHKLNTTYR